MPSFKRQRLGLHATVCAAALLASLTFSGSALAGAASGEVTPAQDNPPGCTTATAEANDGCGAQGRDHFANANHKPPVQACADSTATTGSRITRILPDGPRRPDGSLAFISGACVYLPPGYATSGLQYPVLHVLHGGGGDQADWVTFGSIQAILDRAYAADPAQAVIAVMPDGRSGQFYDYENSQFLIETYVLDYLVPYVDRHFRTIPDRAGRAIVGLSNGGYGAIHFAGKRPDYFVAAGGMSSNIGARTLSGLGADGAVYYQGSVPYQLAENYDGVDLVLDVAAYCAYPDPLCATIAIDLLFTPDHLEFQKRMTDVGHQGAFDLRQGNGAHQFTYWSKWLEERQLPFLLTRLADPRPSSSPITPSRIPASFRYRSIKPHFSVWGYEVTVERTVREFLDLRAVSAGGLEIRGSGKVTVLTAPYYVPGRQYQALGTSPSSAAQVVTADALGRLRISVDLGPSHTYEQFTHEADLAETQSQGTYWTIRKVSISELDRAAPVVTDPPLAPGPGPLTASSSATPTAPLAGSGGATIAAPASGLLTPAGHVVPPLTSVVRHPQLIPTLLFIAVLAVAPALWWRRRRAVLLREAL